MFMKSLLSASGLAGLLVLGLGCAQKADSTPCPEGEEGCPCILGSMCNQGLRCPEDTCIRSSSSGGSSGGNSSAAAGASGGQSGSKSSSSSSSKPAPAPASPNCTDVSLDGSLLGSKSAVSVVDVVGRDKNYFFQANWWNDKVAFNKQTVDGTGLSFIVGNPANVGSSDNDPIGYPSFYIGGAYAGRSATKGSNLPKQVSALKGSTINTILATNANSKGRSNYNVAYDVWFTQSASALSSKQYDPGTGGAYLMVWFFKPSDRQPRGDERQRGKTISGVPGTWDVWVHNTNPPCISYVHSTGVETLDFDLNKFIQDSVSNRYGITESMYLYMIFGGFEIWRGGDGLEVKAFCADVP